MDLIGGKVKGGVGKKGNDDGMAGQVTTRKEKGQRGMDGIHSGLLVQSDPNPSHIITVDESGTEEGEKKKRL